MGVRVSVFAAAPFPVSAVFCFGVGLVSPGAPVLFFYVTQSEVLQCSQSVSAINHAPPVVEIQVGKLAVRRIHYERPMVRFVITDRNYCKDFKVESDTISTGTAP